MAAHGRRPAALPSFRIVKRENCRSRVNGICELGVGQVIHLLLGNCCDSIACFQLRAKLARLSRTFGRQVHRWGQTACIELDFSRCDSLNRRVSDRMLVSVLPQCGSRINRLDLGGCSRPSDKSLEAIAQLCPQLRHIDIGRHGDRCPDACPKNTESAFTDAGVLKLVQGCHEIASFHASQCSQLTDRAGESIGRHCAERLTHLNIGAINSTLTDKTLYVLAAYCRFLKLLDVYGGRFLTDNGISSVTRGCPELRTLNIGMCHNITNQSIQHMARRCRRLMRLEMSGCNVDDAGILELTRTAAVPPRAAPMSTQSHPSYAVVTSAVHGCYIERLDISECTYLTDVAITAVARTFGRHLRDINISYCYLLTDASLSALSAHCPNLEVVTALECDKFTDSALKLLFGCCCASLRSVRIGSELMTDSVLAFIAARCHEVHTIDIAGNDRLTDSSVECVARSCTKLQTLHLSSWSKLTDKALRAVACGCSSLTRLDVSGCQLVTAQGLEHVANSLEHLRTIRCEYCPRVGPRSTFALSNVRPAFHFCTR